MIQRIDDCIHLAELDNAGTLRGSCILCLWIEGVPNGDLYLFGLNTKPEHRRQGVATELIKAAQRVAKLRGNKALRKKNKMSYGWQKFMQATICLVSPRPISERLDDAAIMLLTLSASADANVPDDMKPMYGSILDRLDKHESLTFDEKSSLCDDIFECFKTLHERHSVAGRKIIDR